MIFDLLTPPQGPRGRGKKFDVACPINVSNSHTKCGRISSNGLGVDSITDRRTDGRRRLQYPLRFFIKSVGIKIDKNTIKSYSGVYHAAETGAMKLV